MRKQLVVAAISGDIFQANINKDGMMSESGRTLMTNQVLRATNEWFITNKKKMFSHAVGEGEHAYVFHTTDDKKAERILAILQEEDHS